MGAGQVFHEGMMKDKAKIAFVLAILLVSVLGCAKAPSKKAEEHVDSWADMGMWLPDKEQITFFRDHFADVQEVLSLALSNSNADVRQRAAYVIGEIGPDAVDVGPDLFNRLKVEPKRLVRIYLFIALAAVQFIDPAVIDDLKDRFRLLDDSNKSPAPEPMLDGSYYAAVDEKISVAAALYLLDKSTDRKKYLEFVLRWLRPPSNDFSPGQLEGYWERRWCAVVALERMPEAAEAIPLLEAMLNEENKKDWVYGRVPPVLKALKQNSDP